MQLNRASVIVTLALNKLRVHCYPVASPEGAIRYSIMVTVLQTEQSRMQNSQQIEAAWL